DTTALLAIDAEGNAVSLIQSVFSAWGSGVLSASTGVVFNNRMRGFGLEEGHPNELASGKRPMHTLHNYIVTSVPDLPLAGEASGPPHRQPQTNVQVLDAVLRRGADPQDALDAARWALDTDGSLYAESRTPDSLGEALRAEGLAFEPLAAWDGWTGRACLAVLTGGGIAAAHDLRGEGLAIVG
ncbi:MAG: gamma-glutamyltransferase, partial [Dehalococcoidia bacterium]|nr:gamma-glutamyltransferase [Dehalococcoidia bacterium]